MFFKRRRVCLSIRKVLGFRRLCSFSVSRFLNRLLLCFCMMFLVLIFCFIFLNSFSPWFQKFIKGNVPYLNDNCEETDEKLEELRTGAVGMKGTFN